MDSSSDSSAYGSYSEQTLVLDTLSPEQYDLLQQLKSSKMTIRDVNFALDELDRLELQFNVSIVKNFSKTPIIT